MNQPLQNILEQIQEHHNFLLGIDNSVFHASTREELQAFNKALSEIKTRYLNTEVAKIVQSKKEAEFPELLTVHNYPILKQIDFLTEEQLIELDSSLAGYRNRRSFNLAAVGSINSDDHERLYEWLTAHKVLGKMVSFYCPYCSSESLSPYFPETLKEDWIRDLRASNKAGEPVGLIAENDTRYFGYCECCENSELELGFMIEQYFENMYFSHYYANVMNRNKSLDNV